MSFNNPTFPGVYTRLEADVPRTITGVSTSITAFVGRALRGPIGAKKIFSWTEYERLFGGLWEDSKMSYAVYDYFLNGGSEAVICRVFARKELTAGDGRGRYELKINDEKSITLIARDPGQWSKNLQIVFSKLNGLFEEEEPDKKKYLANLEITDAHTGIAEKHLKVSLEVSNPRFIGKILKSYSNLLRLQGYTEDEGEETTIPGLKGDFAEQEFLGYYPQVKKKNEEDEEIDEMKKTVANRAEFRKIISNVELTPIEIMKAGEPPVEEYSANDGDDLKTDHVKGDSDFLLLDVDSPTPLKMGLSVLRDDVDLFNILSIPQFADTETWYSIYSDPALSICEKRRAFLLIDPKEGWNSWDKPLDDADLKKLRSRNSGLFFPRIMKRDPANEFRIKDFVPSGAVAGIFARTDANVGVWKAPAGIEAMIRGIAGLSLKLTEEENGNLNVKAVNCLMDKPLGGPVIWGSRTRVGSDTEGSPWKYIPVIRMGLFIEESLYRGTQWVVFEPNDEPLWSEIRLSIGAFMHNLFRKGALQGASPKEAYFVKCDKETTTEYDRNSGIVNIIVGFAPLKPAEFVLIKITQISGEVSQ